MPPLPPPSPKQYSQECLNYRVIDCIKRHDEKVCTPKHWSHLQSLLWERSAYIREQSSKTGFYELFIILIWYLFAIVRSINIWRISFTLGSNVTVFGKLAFKECVCVFVCVCAFFLHVLSSLNQILVSTSFLSQLFIGHFYFVQFFSTNQAKLSQQCLRRYTNKKCTDKKKSSFFYGYFDLRLHFWSCSNCSRRSVWLPLISAIVQMKFMLNSNFPEANYAVQDVHGVGLMELRAPRPLRNSKHFSGCVCVFSFSCLIKALWSAPCHLVAAFDTEFSLGMSLTYCPHCSNQHQGWIDPLMSNRIITILHSLLRLVLLHALCVYGQVFNFMFLGQACRLGLMLLFVWM